MANGSITHMVGIWYAAKNSGTVSASTPATENICADMVSAGPQMNPVAIMMHDPDVMADTPAARRTGYMVASIKAAKDVALGMASFRRNTSKMTPEHRM